MKKGESLRDTVETIEAMGVDAIVVRHGSAGVPWQIAAVGRRQRRERRRRLARAPHPGPARLLHDPPASSASLDGLHIAIVGDIKHSRVARSDVLAFTALGARVTLVAPPTLLPPSLAGWPVTVSHDLDDVLPKLDVVLPAAHAARAQEQALVPSLREYTARYGLTPERAARLPEHALVMHPGPMNRGVEIAAEVADLPRSVVTEQVRQRRGRAHGGAVPAARLGRGLGSVATA